MKKVYDNSTSLQKKEFGKKLKKARQKKIIDGKKMTQEDLADEFEVTIETVRAWEQGRSYPPIERIIQLADFLEVDLDYLIGDQDQPNKEYAHISEMTGLSPAATKYLFELKKRSPVDQTLLITLSEMIVQTMKQEKQGSDRSLWQYLTYFMQTDYFSHQKNADATNTYNRDYEADWGALNRELGNFTHDYRRKHWHTD